MKQEIRDKLNGTISIVDNAYRTKNYMVTQHIEIEDDNLYLPAEVVGNTRAKVHERARGYWQGSILKNKLGIPLKNVKEAVIVGAAKGYA